jgi:7,8-dihydropterin-6-yl-methyl-4-(beta-D-ribofuranosyl)aminobenzene 5'-phosphate synthase
MMMQKGSGRAGYTSERKEHAVQTLTQFGETQDVSITVLVDNRADLIVKSTDTVKYFTDDALLAEHGFAALVDLKDAGIRILWDAGITRVALMENAARMEIDLATISEIALSHGHGDHTAAMTDVLKAIDPKPKPKDWPPDVIPEKIDSWLDRHGVPLIAHPAVFRERWGKRKDGTYYGPIFPSHRREWEAAGARIILSEGPYQLGPGCWTTGVVPRRSFEASGRRPTLRYREGGHFHYDDIEDDQAIVINVREKGLVVLAGCAHSGIVNTVNYAREISGVGRVWAVLGGFHLARAEEDELERTIDEIAQYAPAVVAPSHCTGFDAICRFAQRMPEAFVPGVVGVTYLF